MTHITQNLDEAVLFLQKGEVVALPTETVYGLAALISYDSALNRIFELKNRPQDNPLIVHALNIEMIETFAYINEDFLKLHDAFMPGPLTVLLEKKEGLSNIITCGLNTVAVRIPQNPLFLEVLRKVGRPLAAPSANISGRPSSTRAQHVFNDFHPYLPLILEGGACEGGLESTIVRLYDDQVTILRPGPITLEQLQHVLKKPVSHVSKEAPLQAPGMKYRHYAPKARVEVIFNLDGIDLTEKSVMICSQKPMLCPFWEPLTEKNFYQSLRRADELGLKKIVILVDDTLGEGLRNRIEKASS